METETPFIRELAAKVSEYWGYVLGLAGALAAVYAFYRKYIKTNFGKDGKLRVWCRNVVQAPTIIVGLQQQLTFANGMTLQEWTTATTDDMRGIRQMIAFEVISRRNLWDTLKDPLFEASESGKFRWANKAYLAMTGCEMKDVLGHNWRNVIAGPDREEVIDGWEMAVRDGTDFKTKFRLALDNSEKWVRIHVICNRDSFDQVLGFTGRIWEIADPRLPGGGIHETTEPQHQ